jgi:hypothetical protein
MNSHDLAVTAARNRADAIRRGIDALADLPQLVIEAHQAEDWRTLGYGTWQDYIVGEYGTSLIRLDKAMRHAWARSLSDAGVSTREIAPVVNVSYKTVQRDLAGTNVPEPSWPEMPQGLTRVEQIVWLEKEADRLEADAKWHEAEAERLRAEAEPHRRPYQELVAEGQRIVDELKRLGILDEHGRKVKTFRIPATLDEAIAELNRLGEIAERINRLRE